MSAYQNYDEGQGYENENRKVYDQQDQEQEEDDQDEEEEEVEEEVEEEELENTLQNENHRQQKQQQQLHQYQQQQKQQQHQQHQQQQNEREYNKQGYEYNNPREGSSQNSRGGQNKADNRTSAIDAQGYDVNSTAEIPREEEVDQISEEIEEKLQVFEEFAKDKEEEQVLNIRMHQLALSKILVFTHGKSPFKLVEAHTKIGIAYLSYKCYEQAIDHLTIALKKNGVLFAEIKESQGYHAEILTQLAKSYAEVQSYDDAMELLIQANELHKTVRGEGDIKQVETLACLAKCHSQMKEYEKAQQIIGIMYDIQASNYGLKSQQIAMTMVENAKIYSLNNDLQMAIDYQNQAIDVFFEIEYNHPETVASLYQTLSGYYEKSEMISEQIDALQKACTLYEQIYGPIDKNVIKIKRQIAIIFLKNKQDEEALIELLEMEELQTKVYGENSVQVAKTLKIIGTVKLQTSFPAEAHKYLAKALKIFEDNGLKESVKDTKLKIQIAKDLKGKKFDNRQPDYYE